MRFRLGGFHVWSSDCVDSVPSACLTCTVKRPSRARGRIAITSTDSHWIGGGVNECRSMRSPTLTALASCCLRLLSSIRVCLACQLELPHIVIAVSARRIKTKPRAIVKPAPPPKLAAANTNKIEPNRRTLSIDRPIERLFFTTLPSRYQLHAAPKRSCRTSSR
jgi:hypothetical protein